ncbi:hypothetical protein DIPPA_18521 [Diplonema papillatum]|nr:hypothetical protein DIPPA_18521 [Diplonema papillatum]
MGASVENASRPAKYPRGVRPYHATDLSSTLLLEKLPAGHPQRGRARNVPETKELAPGPGAAWTHFTATLKRQGIPFTVIRDAPLRDREELASAVYPKSPIRQEQVMDRWPNSREEILKVDMNRRQALAEKKKVTYQRYASHSAAQRAARREAAGSSPPPPPKPVGHAGASSAGFSSVPRRHLDFAPLAAKRPASAKPDDSVSRSTSLVTARAPRWQSASHVVYPQRNAFSVNSVENSPPVSRALSSSGTPPRARAHGAAFDWLSGRSIPPGPPAPPSALSSGSRAAPPPQSAWNSPAVARAKAAARAARTRSRSRSAERSPSAPLLPKPHHHPGVDLSRPERLRSRSADRDSIRSKASCSVRSFSSGSRTPFRGVLFPVGSMVVATNLKDSYPELNGTVGTVIGPASAESYLPVAFPAPFAELTMHSGKLKHSKKIPAGMPRRPKATDRVFNDFRWMHPGEPPQPPVSILSYATSPPEGKKEGEQGVLAALAQQVRNAEAESGENHPVALLARWRHAIGLCIDEKADRAVALLRPVIDAFGAHAAADLPEDQAHDNAEYLLGMKCTLAAALHDAGSIDDAIAVFKQSVDNALNGNSISPERFKLVELHNISVLLEKANRIFEAEAYARKDLQGMSIAHGLEHPFTVAAKANLSLVLFARGDVVEAALLAQKAMQSLVLDDYPAKVLHARLADVVSAANPVDMGNSVLLVKGADQATGITWTRTTLAGVAAGSPAAKCGLEKFKGRCLLDISGRLITRASEIRSLCTGAVYLSLTFGTSDGADETSKSPTPSMNSQTHHVSGVSPNHRHAARSPLSPTSRALRWPSPVTRSPRC